MIQAIANSVSPIPYLWTVDQYQQIGKVGLFDNQRVELIEGQVLQMSPQGTRHASALMKLVRLLPRIFDDRYSVSIQSPISIDELSQPEPDAAVHAGAPDTFRDVLPKAPLLVVEVSDTTLTFDRKNKSKIYAKAGIEDYWIINLVDNCVEVHRQPTENDGYAQKETLKLGDKVAPLAMPEAVFAVEELLP